MEIHKISETFIGDPKSKLITNYISNNHLKLFSVDRSLHVIKPDDLSNIRNLNGVHKKPIKSVLCSTLAKIVVSISENDQIVIWNMDSLEVVKKFFITKKIPSKLVKAFFSEFDTRLILIFENKIIEIEQICMFGKQIFFKNKIDCCYFINFRGFNLQRLFE